MNYIPFIPLLVTVSPVLLLGVLTLIPCFHAEEAA